MGALGVGDGGLRLLDGVLGGRERVLKIGGDARDIFLGFAQGIGRVGDLHRKLAGAHRVIGGICRRIALQLGILVAQRFELSARGVDGLLCCGNAGVALGLHLVTDALGIFEASNEAVTVSRELASRASTASSAALRRRSVASSSSFICSSCALSSVALAAWVSRPISAAAAAFCAVSIVWRCSATILVVAACDILTRLELLALIGDALLKFGQVIAGVRECPSSRHSSRAWPRRPGR